MAETTVFQYETVIITSAKLGDTGNVELIEKFKNRIEKNGTIENVDDWGKRRLAYPIEKQGEGYYTLINFKSPPDFIKELDRRYQITEGILRTMIIKKDPRIEIKKKALAAKAAAKAAKESTVNVEAIAADSAVVSDNA